jgi:DNA-binding NtrC family response regulator
MALTKPAKTVLLVDDEPMNVTTITDLLNAFGYSVVSARNYTSALDVWSECNGAFDFAILDYALQDGTGIDLAQKFWAEKSNFPVILSSGYGPEHFPFDTNIRDRLLFLRKPFTVTQLREILSRIPL